MIYIDEMKCVLIFLSLLLGGCFDLDVLSSERCPDKKPCPSGQTCVDNKCVLNSMVPKNDMNSDMPDGSEMGDPTACYKMYVSGYSATFYPAGKPMTECTFGQGSCSYPNFTKCGGNRVEQLECRINPDIIIYNNYSNPQHLFVTWYRVSTGAVLYEIVYSTGNSGGNIICERGSLPNCGGFNYTTTWCDTIL